MILQVLKHQTCSPSPGLYLLCISLLKTEAALALGSEKPVLGPDNSEPVLPEQTVKIGYD